MDKLRLVKTSAGEPRAYFEFVINDVPLPKHFGEVYQNWKDAAAESVLDESLIGVLNPVHSSEGQALRIKAFLREEVTVAECQRVLPHTSTWPLSAIHALLEDDFNNEQVLLYCCSACGDRYCPGIAAKVTTEDGCFAWSFDEENLLQFRFDQQEYRAVFNAYLREMSKSN